MTTFDQREDAFEKKYAHDEELTFKARARRNHKVGLWAAQQLGQEAASAEAYAAALVDLEIDGGGSEAIVKKIMQDFAAGGVAKSEHQVRHRMDDDLAEAQREVRSA